MQKVRYETDPYNRLVIAGPRSRKGLPKFRQVLDGRFKLDKKNNLSYHVKAPLSAGENIPHQIRLKGEWSLDDDHNLRLTMEKEGRDTLGDQITLEGNILDAKQNSLLFAVTTRAKTGTQSTYILNLSGSWRADERNRLSFHVKREKGAYDILTFTGAWEIGENYQVVYKYEKADLLRKRKRVHELAFKGYWDIRDRLRVSYNLSGGTDSSFDFETSSGVFRDGYIRYEIGAGARRRPKPAKRTLKLFGKWAPRKDLKLAFEVEYEKRKLYEIVFGADAALTGRDTVSFRLKNNIKNKDIGVSVELSREIFKGSGSAFLRLLASKAESAAYAGAAWRW